MAVNLDKMVHPDYIRAAYAPDSASADQMIAVLELHGITARRGGGIRDLYSLEGKIGEEILVRPSDLEAAQDILSQMTGDDSDTAQPSKSKARAVLCLAAALVILIILILIRGAL